MPDDDLGDAEQLLSDVLTEPMLGAYLKLLDAGAVPKAEANSFLGGPEVVAELIDRGLAHPAPHTPSAPASVQATPPDLAFRAALANLKDTALNDLQVLINACGRLGKKQAVLHGGAVRVQITRCGSSGTASRS